MSEDITAQLAADVERLWKASHVYQCKAISKDYVACGGAFTNCGYPKPSALVAWEQAQQAKAKNRISSFPGNDLASLSCHCPARRGDNCPLTAYECLARSDHYGAPVAAATSQPSPALADKPPLGLMPRWLHNKIRCTELLAAMLRYAEAGEPIQAAWVNEVSEYVRNVKLWSDSEVSK